VSALVELDEQQRKAIDAVLEWYGSRSSPTLTFGGYAGTGKTTCIRHLVEQVPGAAVCAPSGKAAFVLRTKEVPATTIHSLIYVPTDVCSNCGRSWEDCRAELHRLRKIAFQRQQRGAPVVTLPSEIACRGAKQTTAFRRVPILTKKLIIVDEASMVSAEIQHDLESFGIPVLYVGDHGQLEPVGYDNGLMREPTIRLEKIHRQAESSPIIRFAHRVRLGHTPRTEGEDAVVVRSSAVPANLTDFDVVLCGRNRTRCDINERVRKLRGFEGELPGVGERVICLRNDKERKIFNGMQGTVLAFVEHPDDGYIMTVQDDVGTVYPNVPVCPDQFGNEETLKDVSRHLTLWDFGYCLTTHKSQGSQFDRVLVVEQIMRSWSPARWRYTAATRAAKHLTYCMRA
jgi:exodeoxyribonuclease-5